MSHPIMRADLAVLGVAMLAVSTSGPMIVAIFLDQAPPATAIPAGILLLAGVYLVVRAEGRTSRPSGHTLPVD